MTPILLAGAAAAAFFLSGCNQPKKSEDAGPGPSPSPATPVPASVPPDASPDASPAKPSQPIYHASFGMDLRAADNYQKLQEAKVPDASLDWGCHYPPQLGVPAISREKDQRIEACEVYDFVLENYKKYPEIVESLTGKPIPWSLDDRNPATEADEKIRTRIMAVVENLRENPEVKKLDRNSVPYKQVLARALTWFVDFPADPKYLKEHHEELKKQSEVLAELGLKDFQQSLLEKGGLGASEFTPGHGEVRVGSALQALAERRGGAAARAKVLYGVLALADLGPLFVLSSQKTDSDWVEQNADSPLLSRLNFHGRKLNYLRVAVPLGKELFMPTAIVVEDKAPTPQEVGLTAFLAEDFHEEGNFWLAKPKQEEGALLAYKIALNLHPTNSGILNSIGVLMSHLGNQRQAEIAFKEALRFDGTNGFASYNLGFLYQGQGKLNQAVDQYLNTVVFSPQVFDVHKNTIEPAVTEMLKLDGNHQAARGLASKLRELQGPQKEEKDHLQK